MALNQGSILRQQGNPWLEEVLSRRGETAEQSIKRRNGGLDPTVQVDALEIARFLQKKKNGQFQPGEEEGFKLLNPKSVTAIDNTPVSNAADIGKMFSTKADPGFQPRIAGTEDFDPGTAFPEAQGMGATPASFDRKGAEIEALSRGDPKTAALFAGGQKRRTDKFFTTDERGNQFRVQQDAEGDLISRTPTGINIHDKPIKQFSDALMKSKVALSAPPVKIITSIINEAKESGGKVEGVGLLKNKSPSSFFLTPKGKKMRRAVQEIENLKLNLLSGAAVSAHEAVRQAISNARELSSTAEDYVQAFEEQILPAWRNTLEVVKSSVSPEVFAEYLRRNPSAVGIFESFNQPIRQTPVTRKSIEEMTPEEQDARLRELLEKRNAK